MWRELRPRRKSFQNVFWTRLNQLLQTARNSKGQALVELALTLPMIFLLIAITVNFGMFLYSWIAVTNATRAVADYVMMSGSSAGLPATATSASIQNLITNDLHYLPGVSTSNPAACVQQLDNGVNSTVFESATGVCGTYAAPPTETEVVASGSALTYIDYAVDISYTFTPLIPGSRFLGLILPAAPTGVHRRTVVRLL